jgi:4-hydroxy-tetrahydrodipicolinate synthase
MSHDPTGWTGIIPPMVTPFHPDSEELDEDALRAEVDTLLGAGVQGLCVTGSTGEGAAITASEARRVAEVVVHEVQGRVPVISGIIQNSTRMVLEYADAVRDVGVDGLQVTPVHYLFKPDADGTVNYYRAVAGRGLPIMIYNVIPWAFLEAPVLVRLMREVPGVVGVKQSGGDLHKLADLLLTAPPEKRIFSAVDDLLYPSFTLGAHGAIAAILTILPRTSVKLWEAVRDGRHDTARALHPVLLRMWRAVDGPNMPARAKAAIALQGRPAGVARSPAAAVSDEDVARILEALKDAAVSEEITVPAR